MEDKELISLAACVTDRKYVKVIYSAYLEGKSTEDIYSLLYIRYNIQFTPDKINAIIDLTNDALL